MGHIIYELVLIERRMIALTSAMLFCAFEIAGKRTFDIDSYENFYGGMEEFIDEPQKLDGKVLSVGYDLGCDTVLKEHALNNSE